MLRKTLSMLLGKDLSQSGMRTSHSGASTHAQKEHALLKQESRVGASLFGAVPSGHHREFFCLDSHTWVWSEQWTEAQTAQSRHMYVRYEFGPRGVLKTVDGVAKGYVEGVELDHLLGAIKSYHDRVLTEVYGYPVPAR